MLACSSSSRCCLRATAACMPVASWSSSYVTKKPKKNTQEVPHERDSESSDPPARACGVTTGVREPCGGVRRRAKASAAWACTSEEKGRKQRRSSAGAGKGRGSHVQCFDAQGLVGLALVVNILAIVYLRAFSEG